MAEPAFLCCSMSFPQACKKATAAPGITFAIKGRKNKKRWCQSFLLLLDGKYYHGNFLVAFFSPFFDQDSATWPFVDAREAESAQCLYL